MKKLGLLLCLSAALNGPVLAQGPRLDVVFLLDATGSMSDEIDAVKERIRRIISDIALGDPAPDVRFGLVAYRDRGDEYVTRTEALTRDIDRIVENLAAVTADGGGDYPESLVEGVHVLLNDLDWDQQATRLAFLIADAPPHLDYPDDYDLDAEIADAVRRGIAVHAIGASGLDEEGEKVFRRLADETGGQFQWLAYEQRYTDDSGAEVIVRVEGRTATYTRGDSSWTVEGGGGVPLAGGVRAMAVDAKGDAGLAGGAPEAAGPVEETRNNLDDLITATIKDAAAAEGVEYGAETQVERRSWGSVKKHRGGR